MIEPTWAESRAETATIKGGPAPNLGSGGGPSGRLGGKPIKRQAWILGSRLRTWRNRAWRPSNTHGCSSSRITTASLAATMEYPTGGVGHIDWLPWYEPALKIASDLDKSLKTVDAPRRGKTEARLRGSDGHVLRTVDLIRENRPKQKCSIRWCLEQLRKKSPNLRKMPLRQLETRSLTKRNGTSLLRSRRANEHNLRSILFSNKPPRLHREETRHRLVRQGRQRAPH